VGTVRSGDRPTGSTAATDQSAAATDVTGDPEDFDAGRSVTATSPAPDAPSAGETGDGPPGPDSGHDRRETPGTGEQPEPGAGRYGPGEGANGPGEGANGPGESRDKSAEDRNEPGEGRDKPGESGDGPGEDQGKPGESGDGPGEDQGKPGEERQDPAPDGARPHARTALLRRTAILSRTAILKQGASHRVGAARLPAGSRRRRRTDRQPRHPGAAGAGFARITVLPAILMIAWLLIGLPLLLARALLPTPMVLIAVPLAVVLVAGLRRVPAEWPRALPRAAAQADAAPRREPGWPAWWGLAGTVVVAAGFAFWQFLFNSESVIVLRDPGAYLQTGYWIAQHGSLPIPQSLASFGGAHPGLGFASTGFFTRGTAVVPGLMSGLPLVLAGAFWVHGLSAAAAMGPILGGLAVLAFGGLVGRLAGLAWAPAGALVLAFTLPEQYTSRASFSETAAQVLLFGGLCLVVDGLTLHHSRSQPDAPAAPAEQKAPSGPATARGWLARLGALRPGRRPGPQWALMALGGLALGLTAVVRIDGLLDVLPAIPFIGILVVRRSSTAVPFCIGIVVGAAYGLADAFLLARPLLDSLQPLPILIGLIAAWLATMTLVGVELMRLTGFPRVLRPALAKRPLRWLPEVGAGLAVAALVGFAIRPYLQTVRGPSTGAAADFVASLQRLEHLPVDPGRLYAEDTLYWVIWYVGLPAVLLGGFGLALLLRRCLSALLSWREPPDSPGSPALFTARVWALPIAVICCGSAAVLWEPETTPDQPWASRRLVPLVLPGLILCATWACAWLRGRARSRGAGRLAGSFVAGFCVVALLVPTVATTFGLGLSHTGKSGALRPTADGLALKRTGPGQFGAVTSLCSSLGPSATVLIVAGSVAQQFMQVIRGMCAVPVASIVGQPTGDVQSVLTDIERTGRRPVLLAARPGQLYPYGGGSPVRVLDLSTSQDPHTLTQPPTALAPAHYVIWMSSLGTVGTRV
jgi:hypothetical protein